MQPIQAFLFDMDGVVIDTRQAITNAWQELARQVGRLPLTQAELEQHVYGCPATHTFQTLFPLLDQVGIQLGKDILNQSDQESSHFSIPGTLDLLQALRQAGLPTALVTSAPRSKIDKVAPFIDLPGLFNEIITIEKVGRGKPFPDPYLQGAESLGVTPANCLVFEDALSGIQAGRAAGMHCIGVNPTCDPTLLLQAGALVVLSDLIEVTLDGAFLNLNGNIRLPVNLPAR